MSSSAITSRAIERWLPASINELAGNPELKEILSNYIHSDGLGPNLLITGEPGTGKTVAVKAMARANVCSAKRKDITVACGECEDCRSFNVNVGEYGLFSIFRSRVSVAGKEPLNYIPIDCCCVTETELRELTLLRREVSGRILIYLDEVHRLERRQLDQLLLKPLEELDAVWIATSTDTKNLSRAFLRRFGEPISTSLPSEQELLEFIAKRCKAWNIQIDDFDALSRIASRCGNNPAACLRLLARIVFLAGDGERRL